MHSIISAARPLWYPTTIISDLLFGEGRVADFSVLSIILLRGIITVLIYRASPRPTSHQRRR